MEHRSDRGPAYGAGALLLLLALFPWAWPGGLPVGLALVAALAWIGPLRRLGLTHPSSAAGLLLALLALLLPESDQPGGARAIDPILEDVVLRCVEDAEWIAADPWLAEAVASESRLDVFANLEALAPPFDENDAVGTTLRGPAGELVAWYGWTPAARRDRDPPAAAAGTLVEISVEKAYTLVRAVAAIEGGGTVVVGRPLALAEPLGAGAIRPALEPFEGLRFHDTVVTYDPAAAPVALDGGTGTALATLASDVPAARGPRAEQGRAILALGLLAALVLAIRPLRRRDGLRGLILGWGVLFTARLLLLDVPILGDAAHDPAGFAVLLPPELPGGLPTLLASPGDAALTFLTLNLALVLALRNLTRAIRRRVAELPVWLALPPCLVVAGAAALWVRWAAAFAAAAGRPPFVDLTALGDPAVLAVAVSVVLLGSAFVVTALGCGTLFSAALARGGGGAALRLVPAGVVGLAALPFSSAGWALAAATGVLGGAAEALARRRSAAGPGLVAVVILVALAGAAVLTEQQRADFELFAEEQARRWSRQREDYELSILESAVADMLAEGGLGRALEGDPPGDRAAFHAWLASSLSASRRPCRIELFDSRGAVVSRFRVDIPGHLSLAAAAPAATGADSIALRRVLRTIGQREWEMLVATAPVASAAGAGWLSVTILPDGPALVGSGTGALSRRLSRWGADPVVLRYRNGVLVDSNAADAPIGDLLPAETSGLFGATEQSLPGGWREAMLGGRAYRIHWSLQPDGEVLGIGLPVGLHRDLTTLALDSVAVHGVVLFCFWLLLALAGGWGRRIPHLLGQFRVRLMLAIVAVAVFPILFWGSVGTQRLAREREDALRADLERQVDLALSALELDLVAAIDRALAIDQGRVLAWLEAGRAGAAIPAPWGGSGDPVPAQDASPLRLDGSLIYDAGGIERGRSGRTAKVPWQVLKAVLDEGESRTFYQQLEGAPAIVLARPLIGGDGRVAGCVVGHRVLDDAVCERLHALVLNDVRVYGRDALAGTSRSELVAAGLLPELLPGAVWRELMDRGRPRMIARETEMLGARLTVYRALRLSDVVVEGALAVSMPHSGEWSESRETARAISLIVSLSIVWLGLAVAAGLVLSRRISDPLQRLIHGTARIASGALGEEVRIQGRDELARLVAAFNRMSRSLADNRDELEAQRAALEAIIRNLEAGVVSADAGGRIRLSNPAADALLGEEGRPLSGQIETALSASPLTGVDALIEGYRGGGAASGEVPFGEDRTARVSLTRIGEAGRGGRVLLVVEDLTDLIRSQKTLAWAQMARQVAHEIKNPLTPMKLQAQNLLYAYDADSAKFGDTLRESVGVIVEQIERLRRISGEFSRMARPETVGRATLDLGAAVRDALRIYDGTSGGRAALETMIAPDLADVRIGREDVARVVLNLVENARDALLAGDGGTVRVEVHPADLASGAPGVELRVADDGPGISADTRARLFEPYFSTKTSGTGLGLSIVQKIVQDCGGRILVESEPAEGTVFRVLLPAAGGAL